MTEDTKRYILVIVCMIIGLGLWYVMRETGIIRSYYCVMAGIGC